ncbi:hypothetical protein HHI36_009497 [Cryptolaemus montrouzieri]|uniref:TOG domain-containing protein n=1 Tax=Cryptolaemus montrouzieri TaxID=559131 RepID=A0ABD2MGG4_9CUCU
MCTCLKRKFKVSAANTTRPATPVVEISIIPEEETKASHDSPSSLRSIPRQSSGSESSGYFTPPQAERPSAGSLADKSLERPESVKAVTPLDSPRIQSATSNTIIENQTSFDDSQKEEDPVEYIEVIEAVPPKETEDNITQETVQPKPQDISMEDNLRTNHFGEAIEREDIDEVDRKGSCPSINDFELNARPIAENRNWSKSELNLQKSLPIIIDRKNINSAPLIKDIVNNNFKNETEETPSNGPTHICNNTNINITIPLSGTLIQEEEGHTEPTLVRRLSKRYSQVPVLKKPVAKVTKTEGSAKASSKQKTDIVHDVLDQMASPEWETIMTGLRNLGKLAKSNHELIDPHMHAVCLSLSNHIKNLRSQVARAACQASKEMFVACPQKGLEIELEEIVGPLLHRTADTNKFLREDANNALSTMTDRISPAKVVMVLTTKGTTHQNAIVRGTTTRLLEQLVRSHGTEKIFSLGKDIRDRVILAGANALTEGSLETRKQAKALLRHMISHPNFQKALVEAVPPHTIRHIAKNLNSLKNSQ